MRLVPADWRRSAVSISIILTVILGGCVSGSPTAPSPASPTDSPAVETPGTTPSPGTPAPGENPTADDSDPTDTPPVTGTPGFPEWDPPEPPFTNLTVGTANATDPGSHTYTLWNHDDEARMIHVRVLQNGTTIHDQRHEFPALGTLSIRLHTPATYQITVSVVGTNRSRTVTDPVDAFDCNTKGMHVAIREDGIILARAYGTAMICQTPTETATSSPA